MFELGDDLSLPDPRDDERLLALLDALGHPDERPGALAALQALPRAFWTHERFEGAIGALLPAAESEEDEEVAFGLWSLLASLLEVARAQATPADELAARLAPLLEASSAEVRGFAATALGRLQAPQGAAPLAQRLAREEAWDVAMRIIGALSQAHASLPDDKLLPLLQAPTEESVTFAARELGARRCLAARPPLIQRLQRGDLGELARDGLYQALRLLDRAWAKEEHKALFPAHKGAPDEGHLWLQHKTRRLWLWGALTLGSQEALIDRPDPGPRLALRARFLFDAQAHAERLGEGLRAALQLIPQPRPAVAVEGEPDAFEVVLPLGEAPPGVVLRALAALRPLWDRFAQEQERGLSPDERRVQASVEALCDQLHARARAASDLQRRFHSAQTTRVTTGVRAWILARAQHAGLGALLAQDTADLTAADPRAGLVVALSLQEGGSERLAEGARALLTWKHGLAWERLSGAEAGAWLEAGGVPAGSWRVALRAAPTGSHPDPDSYVWLARHLSALLAASWDADSLGELLGLEDAPWTPAPLAVPTVEPAPEPEPEPSPPAPSPDEASARKQRLQALRARAAQWPAPQAAAPAAVHGEPPSTQAAPKAEAAPKDEPPTMRGTSRVESGNPWFASTAATPAAPSSPSLPSSKKGAQQPAPTPPKPTPKQPTAAPNAPPSGPFDPSTGPRDEQGRTPSQIVKDLSANLEAVDIYLRATGINTSKLAQIMHILLNMEMADAKAKIEQAPCLLLEAVPRDRARTIKTVLEGTGARIAVTQTGEGLPQDL